MAHIINTRVKSGNVLVLSGSSVEITGALKTTGTVTAGGNFVGNLTGNADTVTNGVYTTTIANVATTGVTAGNGLTGGGTTGSLTLNVGAGTGITVAADSISVDVGAIVTITGSQSISGAKTFSAATTTFAAVTGTQAQFTAVTGTLVGNASTATSAGTWTNARTLTVGNTGKSVDGSQNVSWTLAEIGAVGVGSDNTFTGSNTFNGAFFVKTYSTAVAYTVSTTDHVVFVSAGPYTVTVPSATTNAGRKLVFKKTENTETTITLSAAAGNIDGGTFELNGPYQSVTLVSNGTNWFVL